MFVKVENILQTTKKLHIDKSTPCSSTEQSRLFRERKKLCIPIKPIIPKAPAERMCAYWEQCIAQYRVQTTPKELQFIAIWRIQSLILSWLKWILLSPTHQNLALVTYVIHIVSWMRELNLLLQLYIDGLMRKLCNSKVGEGWGFWFVDGNSDSLSSEEAQISNNLD